MGGCSRGAVLRGVICVEGHVPVEVAYGPGPEFGLIRPLMDTVRGGLIAYGGAQVLTLSAPVDLQVRGSTAHTTLTLRAGERLGMALHAGWASRPEPPRWRPRRIHRRIKDTIEV